MQRLCSVHHSSGIIANRRTYFLQYKTYFPPTPPELIFPDHLARSRRPRAREQIQKNSHFERDLHPRVNAVCLRCQMELVPARRLATNQVEGVLAETTILIPPSRASAIRLVERFTSTSDKSFPTLPNTIVA